VAATARVRRPRPPAAGGRAPPRHVVGRREGATTRRGPRAARWGPPGPQRLDGAHLEQTVGAGRRRGARPHPAQAGHVPALRRPRGPGRTAVARASRRRDGPANPPAPVAAVGTSREPPGAARSADGRRQRAGQPMGRGRREKGGDQGIGARQQPQGRRWRPTGRQALGLCHVGARNQPWDQRWFPQQAAASTHTVTEKFTGRGFSSRRFYA
jgi:hypothetical protein